VRCAYPGYVAEQWTQKIVSVPASHASLASHPEVVVSLIEEAARSIH